MPRAEAFADFPGSPLILISTTDTELYDLPADLLNVGRVVALRQLRAPPACHDSEALVVDRDDVLVARVSLQTSEIREAT